jgi:hypothetical protein
VPSAATSREERPGSITVALEAASHLHVPHFGD